MNQDVLKAKQDLINEVCEDVKASTTIVLFEYRGLSVSKLTELRRSLLKSGSKVCVFKNTLTKKAFESLNHNEFADSLKGPNAIMFAKDFSDSLKVLTKFAKRNEEVQIKAGLVEGKYLEKDKVLEVSKLPDKNGLLSMILSVLEAPIRNVVCAVKAVSEKQ